MLAFNEEVPIVSVFELTEKEREVLALIEKRCTNREISKKLQISENTVETHVKNILSKMYINRRKEMIDNKISNFRDVNYCE
jgi:DNA-binding CsgD family transcriptional regulator